ncbi:cytochrome P450 [Labrys miyagiensis]
MKEDIIMPAITRLDAAAAVRRPNAPIPPARRLGMLPAIRRLRTNPITVFAREAYEAPFLEIGMRKRVVLVSEPDAITHILLDNAENYRKSRQQQSRLQPALGDGLVTSEGETWRNARAVTAPLFNPKAIGLLFDDMGVASQDMLERWDLRSSTVRPLDLTAEFQRLTYEIVSRTIFSGALDEDRVDVHTHLAIYFDTVGRVDLASLFDLPSWWPSIAGWRARPSLTLFRSVVDRVVAQRLAAGSHQPPDLLDRLILSHSPDSGKPLSASAVADNVLTFLVAGHETTANALAWAIYLLALFPDAEQRVLRELKDVCGTGAVQREQLGKLTYTRAVVNEVLRLYPPAPFMGRQAIADDDYGRYPVTGGTQIVISPWIVHRHRLLWDAPDEFRPERFLEGEAPARGAYIPFGLGPRICIGQGFALQEILTVLATVLPRFSFELVDPAQVFPHSRITLSPERGLPAIVRPRPM